MVSKKKNGEAPAARCTFAATTMRKCYCTACKKARRAKKTGQ